MDGTAVQKSEKNNADPNYPLIKGYIFANTYLISGLKSQRTKS